MMPDLASWMALSREELAAQVAPYRLAGLVSLDGTRRWTYLHDAESRTDWKHYVAVLATATLALIERCFAVGLETVIIPALYPPNFERGEEWLRASLGIYGLGRLVDEEHQESYRRWDVRARIGGTWRAAEPWAVSALGALNQQLTVLTPTGGRLLIWECDAGDLFEATLQVAAKVGPNREAVRAYFHPDGPEQVHFWVTGGRPRIFNFVPPALLQHTDIYVVTNLPLDLSEAQLRAILYDHLFQRRVAPEDNMAYSDELLSAYRDWYLERPGRIVGLGELAPGGIWLGRGGLTPDDFGHTE
jgi:hypothetical protein